MHGTQGIDGDNCAHSRDRRTPARRVSASGPPRPAPMRLMRALVLLVAVAALAGCASVQSHKNVRTGQYPQAFLKKSGDTTLRANYLLYIPDKYPAIRGKWPLVLFLHGKGERGSDISAVARHGLPKEIARGQMHIPFIVVSPQCPDTATWTDQSQIDVLDALLDDIVARCDVDEDRIYLTGLSMGGSGTWSMAAAHPDRFAAIAPVCGRNDPAIAPTIAHLPIWIFHGEKDPVVDVSYSRNIAAALEAAGSDFEFTVYPETKHDSWTATYSNPELYAWFLRHRRARAAN